ncbi:hypothetical protein [Shivajiella indica]|uniref:Uncharacterized protein n=1 Tax=Shivajiella indica TaxID=872115 RepID=A0ABW5B7S9_9BACT
MRLLLIWIFLMGNPGMLLTVTNFIASLPENDNHQVLITYQNKTIPEEIFDPVKKALEFFPELKGVHITFELKDKISGSVMQAQPKVFSLFVDGKENRKYRIKITRKLDFGDQIVPIENIPKDALIGWIGHELGHIMDYLNRSSVNMMHFGAKYFLSKQKVIEAELTADGFAIGCGMGRHILANKNYILNNDGFTEEYKYKIRNLYMSPEQILTMLEEID